MYNQYGYRQPAVCGDDIKVVNSISSAEQYSMMPNSRVILMDANLDRFYLKETDASGMARIKTYDFTEVKEPPQPNYITMEQLEEVLSRYEFTPKQKESDSQFINKQQTKF